MNEPRPFNLGTIKGLAEFALATKVIMGIGDCPHDIEDFSNTIYRSQRSYFDKLARMNHEARKEELLQLHTVLRWLDHGMPVFELTHSLMAALLLTDPSDVDAADVKMPFPTFAVRLPNDFWHLVGHTGERVPAVHALVHEHICVTTANMMMPTLMLSFRVVGKDGLTNAWENRLPIPDADKIGAWIADDVPEILIEEREERVTIGPLASDDKHIMVAFRRLLVNLSLYVAAHGRGEPLSRRKLHTDGKINRASARTAPQIWVIGREIKLDRGLLESAKAWSLSRDGVNTSGWRIQSRFTVRGHWRNQAHGPERSLRRLTWIQPYWKGQGPNFAHTYTSD